MSLTTTQSDGAYVQRLDEYLRSTGVAYRFLTPGTPMPTVPLAAAAIGADEVQILKTLLFEGTNGEVVLVIANGASPVDPAKISSTTGLVQPRLSKPRKVLELTGFPAGGVPPVGHATLLRTLIDERVMELEVAYGGGGTEDTLVELRPSDIVRLTNAEVVSVSSDTYR